MRSDEIFFLVLCKLQKAELIGEDEALRKLQQIFTKRSFWVMFNSIFYFSLMGCDLCTVIVLCELLKAFWARVRLRARCGIVNSNQFGSVKKETELNQIAFKSVRFELVIRTYSKQSDFFLQTSCSFY